MYDRFHNVLLSVFWYRCLFLLLFVLLIAIINIAYLISKKKKIFKRQSGRKVKKIQDYEKIKRSCIAEFIVGLTGIISFFLLWATPPLLDAHNDAIVRCEGLYYREEVDEFPQSLRTSGNIYITVNENVFSAELYPGFSEDEFPQGTHHAIMWYGEKSKVLLKVIPID